MLFLVLSELSELVRLAIGNEAVKIDAFGLFWFVVCVCELIARSRRRRRRVCVPERKATKKRKKENNVRNATRRWRRRQEQESTTIFNNYKTHSQKSKDTLFSVPLLAIFNNISSCHSSSPLDAGTPIPIGFRHATRSPLCAHSPLGIVFVCVGLFVCVGPNEEDPEEPE